MRLSVETYLPLILTALLPWLWRAKRSSVAGLSPRHLQISTIIRTTIVAFLIVAMMQPALQTSGTNLSVIYLLDVSSSVSGSALQNAIQWIKNTEAAGHAAHSRFIAFAANSIAFN